jgi:hypothetical protein
MLLCSRNARPQKALVGRAQREHNSRPHFIETRTGLRGEEEEGRTCLSVLCSRSAHTGTIIFETMGDTRSTAALGPTGMSCLSGMCRPYLHTTPVSLFNS